MYQKRREARDSFVRSQLHFQMDKRKVIRGTMEGSIGYEIKGENGFGYDPIFYLPQYGKYSAELTSDEKNAISHRGEALRRITRSFVNKMRRKFMRIFSDQRFPWT